MPRRRAPILGPQSVSLAHAASPEGRGPEAIALKFPGPLGLGFPNRNAATNSPLQQLAPINPPARRRRPCPPPSLAPPPLQQKHQRGAMEFFHDGQYVKLWSRVRGTYLLHADEDGHGVSLSAGSESLNTVCQAEAPGPAPRRHLRAPPLLRVRPVPRGLVRVPPEARLGEQPARRRLLGHQDVRAGGRPEAADPSDHRPASQRSSHSSPPGHQVRHFAVPSVHCSAVVISVLMEWKVFS